MILREGHLTCQYLDGSFDTTLGIEKQGWTRFALTNFDVYEFLVRWFYKYVNIQITNKGYDSTVTWSVDVRQDGETMSFKYDSNKLHEDFGMALFGFNDLSLDSEKSHAWKPVFDRMRAFEIGKKVEVTYEEEFSTRLVQTIFMPTTNLTPYQQNAQLAIASKLLLNEPINLPVIIAKHMINAQCDPTTPTIPYGGLVTFIMKQWLLLQPFGIKKESFFFGSDVFDDQRKIIKELITTHDIRYESEPSDEEEEKTEEDPQMMEDELEGTMEVHTEADSSDEEDGEYESYTVEEMIDLFKAQTQRRHQRIRAELRSIRSIINEMLRAI